MAIIFHTPALQAPKDFRDLGKSDDDLKAYQEAWNAILTGWTGMSVIGNPWSNQYDAPRARYYNPAESNQGWPHGGEVVPIQWTPFPNRLLTFYTQTDSSNSPQLSQPLTMEQVQSMADLGHITINGRALQLFNPDPQAKDVILMPETKCPQMDWKGKWVPFSPGGPRGWLDEYCEWSIEWVDDKPGGRIKSVMFTCENPAYWMTMWRLDPKMVVDLYRQYIDPAVQEKDLYLTFPDGSPVPDPTTGRYAYNPTNKWNSGTQRLPGKSGGAIHLTSPPNTLGAEIYLAAASTIQRETANYTNPQALICCSQYGQNFRNSDPHIGAAGNQAASKVLISLTDPVGLYMQRPNWSLFETPDDTPAQDFWKITRGELDPQNNEGMDSILHVVFEVPEDKGYTVSDIKIKGKPIKWVGQIADTFHIALRVTAKSPDSSNPPPKMPCVAPQQDAKLQPWPVQLLPESLFKAESSTALPALLKQGTEVSFGLVVQGATKDTTAENSRIQFDRAGVSAAVTKYLPTGTATPGQTDGGGTQAYLVSISVAADADPGLIGIRALNPYESNDVSAADHPYEAGLAMVVPEKS